MCRVQLKDMVFVSGFRTFLASIRFTGSRFDLYYEKVLCQGSGYPTADEARRDIQIRDRQLNANQYALYR
jgi:hypothetical protein